jgi:hypothetical protein
VTRSVCMGSPSSRRDALPRPDYWHEAARQRQREARASA